MKFSIMDFFSKCDQIRRKLNKIWLIKYLYEYNFKSKNKTKLQNKNKTLQNKTLLQFNVYLAC